MGQEKDDLRSIIYSLPVEEQEYVINRSKSSSDRQAYKAAGISRSSWYSKYSEEDRDRLNGYATRLRRNRNISVMFILDESAEEAAKTMVKKLKSDSDNVALKAASEILDRTTGKPTQKVEASGAGGGPIVVKWPEVED